MSFAEKLEFKDLTKLLEALSTTKSIKKRDEYASQYFEKLHKFRDDFTKNNKQAVRTKVRISFDIVHDSLSNFRIQHCCQCFD